MSGDLTQEEIEALCALIPTEDICQQKPEPTPVPVDPDMKGDTMMQGDHERDFKMKLNPMEGQITFTAVALTSAIGIALETFKWRADNNGLSYYNLGDTTWTNGTNWWKLYNQIGAYAGLVLWGAASITQLASLAGVAADINLMVWWFGIGMVGSLVSLVVGALAFYAKWSAFTVSRDTTKSSGEQTAAGFVYSLISSE